MLDCSNLKLGGSWTLIIISIKLFHLSLRGYPNEILREHRDFHQIIITSNFYKSLITYDVDVMLNLLNKKKRNKLR